MSGSDYLNVKGSPAEIIAQAELLRAKGEAFQGDMAGLVANIQSLDGPQTLGRDHFADTFNRQTYAKLMEAGDGNMVPAHDAAQQSATAIANKAADYGGGVSDSMQNYMLTDEEGAAQIASAQYAKQE